MPSSPRREETLRRILDAAWGLSRAQGLAGWTVRDLGAAVGMRAPSLYEYAGSKNALFDLMFADGYRQLLVAVEAVDRTGDPVRLLHEAARLFVGFAAAEPCRFQLLFQHTAPGFVPSAASMDLAQAVVIRLAEVLAEAGVTDPAELDLWTAVVTGLASQQVANDPGGERWLRLVDTAVDRLLPASPTGHANGAEIGAQTQPNRQPGRHNQ